MKLRYFLKGVHESRSKNREMKKKRERKMRIPFAQPWIKKYYYNSTGLIMPRNIGVNSRIAFIDTTENRALHD